MRKIKRLVAKEKMHKKGLVHVCKKTGSTASPAEMKRGKIPEHKRSYFANNWREAALKKVGA